MKPKKMSNTNILQQQQQQKRSSLPRGAKTLANELFKSLAQQMHPRWRRTTERPGTSKPPSVKSVGAVDGSCGSCVPADQPPQPFSDDIYFTGPIYSGHFSQVWQGTANRANPTKIVVKFNRSVKDFEYEYALLNYMRRFTRTPSPHLLYLSFLCPVANNGMPPGLGFDRAICDLSQVVRFSVSLDRIARMATEIFEGLAALHDEYDIVHTDIKLQNIFVFSHAIKLGDFGCALLRRPSAILPQCPDIGRLVGNPEVTSVPFRAPEISASKIMCVCL